MELRKNPAERKVDSIAFKREFRAERGNSFRIAGKIFADSSERQLKNREVRQSRQKARPTGVGFGERDSYGPDNSWASQDNLKRTHDQDHYIVGKNHGFVPYSV